MQPGEIVRSDHIIMITSDAPGLSFNLKDSIIGLKMRYSLKAFQPLTFGFLHGKHSYISSHDSPTI